MYMTEFFKIMFYGLILWVWVGMVARLGYFFNESTMKFTQWAHLSFIGRLYLMLRYIWCMIAGAYIAWQFVKLMYEDATNIWP